MKIDRLFAITNLLIDKKSVTAAELAQKFQVSVRTIYRDIDILSTNGIPIITSQGKGGGISLMDHYSIDKNLFSEEEQKEILMALQTVQAMDQFSVEDSLSKLRGLFQRGMDSWIEIDFSGWEESEEQKELFALLKQAIWDRKAIIFDYIDAKGQRSKRTVEPLRLVYKGYGWYLYGYCKMRKDFRFFKMIRMEQVKQLDENVKKKVEDKLTFSFIDSKKQKLEKVQFFIQGAQSYRVYDEFRMAKITKQKDGFLVDGEMAIEDGIFGYLASFGPDLKILRPESLQVRFKEYIKKIQKLYET